MKHGQRTQSKLAIKKMIQFRKEGMSFPEIAKIFGIDHSSVVYHWQRYTGIGKTGSKNPKLKPKSEYKKRAVDTTLHCPVCDLLWTSKYSCEYCHDSKKRNELST